MKKPNYRPYHYQTQWPLTSPTKGSSKKFSNFFTLVGPYSPIVAKIEISSKKHAPGRISKTVWRNRFLRALRIQPQRVHSSKKDRKLFKGSLITYIDGLQYHQSFRVMMFYLVKFLDKHHE